MAAEPRPVGSRTTLVDDTVDCLHRASNPVVPLFYYDTCGRPHGLASNPCAVDILDLLDRAIMNIVYRNCGNLKLYKSVSLSDGSVVRGGTKFGSFLMSFHYEGSRSEAAFIVSCLAHSVLVKNLRMREYKPPVVSTTVLLLTYKVCDGRRAKT